MTLTAAFLNIFAKKACPVPEPEMAEGKKMLMEVWRIPQGKEKIIVPAKVNTDIYSMSHNGKPPIPKRRAPKTQTI